jgi:two-component system, NtrC family, response regulator HydG
VISIQLPPLRERREDIVPLAEHFLKIHCKADETGKPVAFHKKTLDILENYSYPGNVRELENAIERAAAMGVKNKLMPEDLPPDFFRSVREQRQLTGEETFKAARTKAIDQFEKAFIIKRLQNHRGNVSRASTSMGMGRTALQRFLKKHHIHSGDYKT